MPRYKQKSCMRRDGWCLNDDEDFDKQAKLKNIFQTTRIIFEDGLSEGDKRRYFQEFLHDELQRPGLVDPTTCDVIRLGGLPLKSDRLRKNLFALINRKRVKELVMMGKPLAEAEDEVEAEERLREQQVIEMRREEDAYFAQRELEAKQSGEKRRNYFGTIELSGSSVSAGTEAGQNVPRHSCAEDEGEADEERSREQARIESRDAAVLDHVSALKPQLELWNRAAEGRDS